MRPFMIAAAAAVWFCSPAWAEGDREIVRVNGTPIRQSEVVERLLNRYGNETLDEMVDELLLRQAASAKKLKADPADVERRLAQLRSQYPNPQIFETQLSQSGTTIDKLKETIGEQIVREKLVTLERGLSVKEDEIKKAFEAHKEDLGTPPGIHMRHIVVKTEAEAKEIVRQVRAGADFAKLAREKSIAPTGKASGGDYGVVSKGMIPADWWDVVSPMKPGELKVMPTQKGYHVIETLEKRGAVPADYAKVKDDLRGMLMQQKFNQSLPEYLKELRAKADIKPQGG